MQTVTATAVPTATVVLDDILKIIQNPAVVAIITALVTLWAKSWFDRRQEREKVRASHTYPKAFEALNNLHSALVDAYEAFLHFNANTLERPLSLEKVLDLITKVDVFSRARLVADVYLDTAKAHYLLLVLQATFVTAIGSIVMTTLKRKQMAKEYLDEEERKLLEMWTRKTDEFNWGDIDEHYKAALATLAPLLRP